MALLSGCGKHDVKGQAFIVTKGMTNIHLGLVEVKFFSADLVTASIQKSKNALGARVADLRTGIEKNDQAITVEIRSFVIGPLVFPSKAPSGQPQSEFSRLSAELDEQKRQLDNIVSPQSLVANFPLPVAIGKTDGDGRFAVKLSAGNYVAVASAQRDVGRSTETYHWLVRFRVPLEGDALLLSNDNMHDTGCSSCVTFDRP